ncbi:IS110 family transposase [Candidatus Contubernalis alkaliaceticus]|uniref:IS110 family transposase n=1 Tax=Candidatus Contubernalis alkaliaceticus TaxID=338645 RepID=UPI001F4C0669|nr:IS110 family transposase [Candidatus Contubernalis alkalaceticus]
MIEELELLMRQLEQIESAIELALDKTRMKEIILGIPGIGIVTAASFLGEIGDPLRFAHPCQINKMAGYNLVEDSSGKNISGTYISKRGRKNLRNVLYQINSNNIIHPLPMFSYDQLSGIFLYGF